MIVSFNLVLSHEEKRLYPDPKNGGVSEVYKEILYLEIPDEVRANPREAHKTLIKEELGHSC